MRTLLLALICVGLGFGIAKFQHDQRTGGVKHLLGPSANMEESIKEGTKKTTAGKVEVVNGPDLDFGTMVKGSKRNHKFILKNVGDEEVRVWYMSSTCKCTVGKLDKKTLAPDESTEVDLEWTVEGLLDEFAQTATIGTSAVDQEEIKLTIHGRVGQNYVFDPPSQVISDFLSNAENSTRPSIVSTKPLSKSLRSLGPMRSYRSTFTGA
jgi:hypothetical protein